jgi:hypothetical protein
MKYMIASDIHGSAYWAAKLLNKFDESEAERLILLGDLLYHGPRNDLPDEYNPKVVITELNKRRDKLICVRGNCDTEVDQMVLDFPILSDSAIISDFGQRVFASHGHKFNPENLPPLSDGDIFLYGHTHIPKDEIIVCGERKIRCINPGSVSIPKNNSGHRCLFWENGKFSPIFL